MIFNISAFRFIGAALGAFLISNAALHKAAQASDPDPVEAFVKDYSQFLANDMKAATVPQRLAIVNAARFIACRFNEGDYLNIDAEQQRWQMKRQPQSTDKQLVFGDRNTLSTAILTQDSCSFMFPGKDLKSAWYYFAPVLEYGGKPQVLEETDKRISARVKSTIEGESDIVFFVGAHQQGNVPLIIVTINSRFTRNAN